MPRRIGGRRRRRTPHPACADTDRSPRIRNSVASSAEIDAVPDQRFRLIAGARHRARSRRTLRLLARARRREIHIDRLVDLFTIGSSVTTQVCRTVALTRPLTCRPSRPRRVQVEASRLSRSTASTPAGFASAARVSALASSSTCRPDSGTSSTRTGTLQGRSGAHRVTPRPPQLGAPVRKPDRRPPPSAPAPVRPRLSRRLPHIGRKRRRRNLRLGRRA